MSPGSLSFAKLLMMSSIPVKSAVNARYASQDPFVQSTLFHTISTPICISSAFFLRRTQQLLLPGNLLRFTTGCFMSILMHKFRSCLYPGFDDQDMERPLFSQPAQYPLVPLVLLKPDAQRVIQVRILIIIICMAQISMCI